MVATTSDEQMPLLNQNGDDMPQSKALSKRHRNTVLLITFIIIVVADLGAGMFVAPTMELLEDAICRKYYHDITVGNDGRCKGDDIQKELVTLNSWTATFLLLPGVFFAMPYGILADSLGRRISLFLALAGVILMFTVQFIIIYLKDYLDLRWIWATGLITAIGGGNVVLQSTVFAIINDVASPENRSIIFFYAGSATMGAMMCAGPLAYSAMQISPWFCVSVGVTLCALSLPLIFLLPETRQLTAKAAGHLVPEEDCEPSHGSNISWVESARRELPALLRYQFWDNKLLGTCLVVITFTTLGKSMSAILLQYATKRFGWKWEEANLLDSLKIGVAIVMTGLVMPAASVYMRKGLGLSLIGKDLWLVRLSFAVLLVGSLAVGLSPTPATLIASLVIYAIGSGNELAMRGLISQAAGDRVATVFTTMGVLENIGIAASGPVLTAVYKLGIQLKGGWLALPFFLAAFIFLIANGIFFSIPSRRFESLMAKPTERAEEDA